MTYNVFGGILNLNQSFIHCQCYKSGFQQVPDLVAKMCEIQFWLWQCLRPHY